jgi:hypothetical protein
MSDRQAGECPARKKWRSWRAKLRVSPITRSRTLAPAIICRKNYGMRSWPIRVSLEGRRCRSSNAASRKFRAMCSESNASAAFGSSKFRRRTRSSIMGRMPSGKMSGSDCSTRRVTIGQAGMRRMDAGPIGALEFCISRIQVARLHLLAMPLYRRSGSEYNI